MMDKVSVIISQPSVGFCVGKNGKNSKARNGIPLTSPSIYVDCHLPP
jgi:hypothetical protein